MEYTLRFSTRERMKKALSRLEKNPKLTCTCYGRDWSQHNFSCPWSPMFYVSFTVA